MFRRLNLQNLVFLGIAAYLVVLLFTQQGTLDRLREEHGTLQTQIEEETERQKKLQEELERVGTDAYIEEKAREELGYVKQDETVYISDN